MTDKMKGLIVTFKYDIRDDDVEKVTDAINLMECVASVKPVIGNATDQMNRERVKFELKEKLWKVVSEDD